MVSGEKNLQVRCSSAFACRNDVIWWGWAKLRWPSPLALIYGIYLPEKLSFLGMYPFPYQGSSISSNTLWYLILNVWKDHVWYSIDEKAKQNPWKSSKSQFKISDSTVAQTHLRVHGLAVDVRHMKPVTILVPSALKDGQSSWRFKCW